MTEPLVSIIIPVYNGSNYMREAIDSALSQTYENIEVIVVNDGSNDNGMTESIAKSYGERIRYIAKENGGVSSALNVGIKEMHGEYFSWLSHDDVYTKDKIEKQILAINENNLSKNTLVCCGFENIDDKSQPFPKQKRRLRFKNDTVYNSPSVLMNLLTKATFNGCCLLIPKEALLDCGMFDENLRFCQDALMWYKIFMRDYSLFCINDLSVKNRVHNGQLTQKAQGLFRKECAEISDVMVKDLLKISTKETNYLKMYLFSDARYFDFYQVNKIAAIGKAAGLISMGAIIKAQVICGYGHIRPFIRKVYYAVFRGVKTT